MLFKCRQRAIRFVVFLKSDKERNQLFPFFSPTGFMVKRGRRALSGPGN